VLSGRLGSSGVRHTEWVTDMTCNELGMADRLRMCIYLQILSTNVRVCGMPF
jgi:hypothetical protein